MDQKSVLRAFNLYVVAPTIKDGQKVRDSHSVLQMLSTYEGEYGRVRFLCEAELDTKDQNFQCYVIEDSAQDVSSLFLLRHVESIHFLTKILPLFNPLNPFPIDALPFPPAQES